MFEVQTMGRVRKVHIHHLKKAHVLETMIEGSRDIQWWVNVEEKEHIQSPEELMMIHQLILNVKDINSRTVFTCILKSKRETD